MSSVLFIAIFFTGSQNSKSSHTNPWEDAVPVQGQCLSGTLTCRPCLLLDKTLLGILVHVLQFLVEVLHQKKGFILMADKKEPFYQVLVYNPHVVKCRVSLQGLLTLIAFLQNFVSYLADFLQDSQGFWPHSCMILHFISCKPLQNFSSCNKNLRI